MPISAKQQASVRKYKEKSYDRLEIFVPKGEKENLKTHAATKSESLNGFVNRAMKETIARDNQKAEE